MRRLSISLLLVVLVATIGVGWTLDRLFIELQPEESDRLAPYRQMGRALASAVATGQNAQALVESWPADAAVQLALLQSSALALPDVLQSQLEDEETLTLETEEGILLLVPVQNSLQVLSFSLPQQTSITESLLRFFLTLLFYVGIIALILLWVFPLVRRLHGLSKAAVEFGAGNFSARVPERRFSLIKGIEREFNAMAERISGLVEDNRLLTSAVSHDLRTPIARLRFGLDAVREEIDPVVQKKYLRKVSGDLAQMEHLVEVLLDYARLEKKRASLPLESVNLISQITHSVNTALVDAPCEIIWQPHSKAVWVMANERYLEMVINNLLQNAQRYGHSKTRVTVKQSQQKPLVWIEFEDDGPGINEDERARVLKPFERGSANTERPKSPPAQSEKEQPSGVVSSGFGMGLAIVQKIVDWHGGDLILGTSDALGGASVKVSLQSSDTTSE